MRLNRYLAQALGLSRRKADGLIAGKRVKVNGTLAELGREVGQADQVTLDSEVIKLPPVTVLLTLNKPAGFVCSRDGQGSKTVYDLLPPEFHNLKSVGRLDKDSSGLLLFTNNGQLAHELTHPSFQKNKTYEIELDRPLAAADKIKIETGVILEDGLSKLKLEGNGKKWTVTMNEGRNRQIRRTFEALGYKVTKLHRTHFGEHSLNSLAQGKFRVDQRQ